MRVRGSWGELGVAVFCLLTPWLFGPARAVAQPGATKEGPVFTLAATAVKARGGVDPEMVQGLDQLVAVEAGRDPRISVISSSDIQAMLGIEAQRQLLACGDSSSCLTELGGALGVAHLLTTEVSRVGKNWLLYVTLLNVADARVIAREVRRPEDADALVDETIAAVRAVVGVLVGGEGASSATAVANATRPEKAMKPLDARPWLRWGGSALGAGLALTGGLAFYAPAAKARSDHRSWLETGTGQVDPPYNSDEARAFEKQGDLGLVLMGSGVALIAAGWVVPKLMGPKSESRPGAAVVLGPGRAILVVGGAF